MDRAFTFNDIILVPDYSDIERGEIDISSDFFGHKMKAPILSSPMDTITGKKMANAMLDWGAFGIHFNVYSDLLSLDMISIHVGCGIGVSPSVGADNILRHVSEGTILVLDVAHGNTKRNLDFAEQLVKAGHPVVSGNIVTYYAALQYIGVGVTHMRVGIGSGSACTTRMVTGCGYPQASAILEVKRAKSLCPDMKIISDGGHRTTGDIVKALALGADFVMLGGMLAGTNEAAGGTKFRGMASEEVLSARKKEYFVEGISTEVPPKGSVSDVLDNIKDAIETACYYLGVRNLKELQEVEPQLITENAYLEGLPQWQTKL